MTDLQALTQSDKMVFDEAALTSNYKIVTYFSIIQSNIVKKKFNVNYITFALIDLNLIELIYSDIKFLIS